MNLGLVVEGPSDRAAYPALVQRIRDDIGELQIRDCGGKSKLRSAFVGFLKEFQRNRAWQIGAALVIRDSDCKPPEQIENALRRVLLESGFAPGFPVEFVATKCELETWLLADENAINQVSQQRGKNRQVAPIAIQLENQAKAKQLFHEQLSKADLPATAEIYKEIAGAANINQIARRCPQFRRFVERLRKY